MARCGCSQTCSCVIEAGCGTTVTGNGTPARPYSISAHGYDFAATDSGTVDHTVTRTETTQEGDCTVTRFDLTSAVIFSRDAGNTATTGSDGGVFVPAGAQTVVTGAGDTTVTGSGTAADPYVVSSNDCCPTVVAGPSGGTTVTPSTGPDGQTVYTVDSAPGGGGTATVLADGDNTTLSGTGTAADPYRVHACAPTAGCGIMITQDAAGCPIISLNLAADGASQFALVPGVNGQGGTTGAGPVGVTRGTEACLTYTNDTCRPMSVVATFRSGQRNLRIHAGASQVQVSAEGSFSFPNLSGAITVGATAAALSNRITPAVGGTSSTDAAGTSHPPMVAFEYGEILQPGQSASVCARQTVNQEFGTTSGSALDGLLFLTAVPAA